MKTFPELLRDRFWAEYVLKWRDAILQSPAARSKGYDTASGVEDCIAAFVYGVVEEQKSHGLKKFAYDLLDPTLVTFDGQKYYPLAPPRKIPRQH